MLEGVRPDVSTQLHGGHSLASLSQEWDVGVRETTAQPVPY